MGVGGVVAVVGDGLELLLEVVLDPREPRLVIRVGLPPEARDGRAQARGRRRGVRGARGVGVLGGGGGGGGVWC